MAQEPVPTLTVPNFEVYGGFVVTSPDYGLHWSDFLLHGFEGGVSKGLTPHLWVTASFDFVFANPTIPNVRPRISSPRTSACKSQRPVRVRLSWANSRLAKASMNNSAVDAVG
jgi:hypothetical protein